VNEWNIQKLIVWTTQHFSSKGINSSRLDAELLLAKTLKCKRLDLYLRFDQPVSAIELQSFKSLVLRRSQREPIAYILGQQEFFNRVFEISPGVLIPRPETESVIEEALAWAKTKNESELSALDIGSGSGAISVTLPLEDPRIIVTALDISSRAVSQTKINAEKMGVGPKVKVEGVDFLEWQSSDLFDLVISNPPYIGRATAPSLESDVRDYEPHEALFGGEKGHETLQQWIPKMAKLIKPSGLLLCEIGYNQREVILNYAQETGILENIEVMKDYSGHPRILRATKKAVTQKEKNG